MFELRQVVPWGRSFHEYRQMFRLTDADLGRFILGCGDGPAGFNAEATRRGGRVISCDPIYGFTAGEIERRIQETHAEVVQQTRANQEQFVWEAIPTVEALAEIRLAAMGTFLADFPQGKREGRYVEASLPWLPFQDQAFDLAVCSHLLFLYSAHLSEAFHLQAMAELCRVAREVRIFPLLALDGTPSPHLEAVVAALGAAGLTASQETVDYEFQKGGNRMLRVIRLD
jgi:hypothetical protein